MLYSPRRFADDVRLFKRASIGAFIGLAALLAWALSYASLYGTNGLAMSAFLGRSLLFFGAPSIGGGVLCGFVVHLMREQRGGKEDAPRHRSFWPSDLKWRETPWIVLGFVGYALLISGFWDLINGHDRWKWQLSVAFPCLAMLVARWYRGGKRWG